MVCCGRTFKTKRIDTRLGPFTYQILANKIERLRLSSKLSLRFQCVKEEIRLLPE
jgi:hypothetical protein